MQPSEAPKALTDLLPIIEDAARDAVETAGPRYFAYFPSGGLYASALGEFLGQVLNRYTGVNGMAPSLCRLERDLISWFCEKFDLPSTAGGVFSTGASLATLTALHAAREARLGSGDATAVLYVTEHTHLSTAKAARILGFDVRQLQIVPITEDQRMDVAALRDQISSDRRSGLRPFLVAATAGTTSCGVIDPLDAVADVCATEGLWFHVDAAYGGGFWLTRPGRLALDGMHRADSLVWDPHKSLSSRTARDAARPRRRGPARCQ